jgi:hypothetical protein
MPVATVGTLVVGRKMQRDFPTADSRGISEVLAPYKREDSRKFTFNIN